MITDQLHIVDFQSEKVVGVINTEHYWDDLRHWELKNNIDTFEFKISTLSEYMPLLQQQNIILKEVSEGRFIPYVIIDTDVDSLKKELTVYTAAEWIRLGKDAIIKPQILPQMSTYEMLQICLQETDWLAGNAEFNGLHGLKIEKFMSPLEMIKEMCKLYELEVEYQARIGRGGQIVRSVDMIKRRGRFTGKEVVLGKDLIGVRRMENSQNICTALVPYARKEDGTLLTIEEVNYGSPYIADAGAFQRWGVRGKHKFGFYEPEVSDQDMDARRLLTLAKIEFKKRINASVKYVVEAQSVETVFGMDHEKIAEGDTIYIKDHGFTPTLILEARVLAGDHSRTNPDQIKYVFGDFIELTDPQEALRLMYERILAQLNNKASKELTDRLDQLIKEAENKANQAKEESQAAKTLAEKVIENLDNYQTAIQESVNPPTDNLVPGKTLWLDISKGKPGILKKWNGSDWEPIVPDYGNVDELNERVSNIDASVKGITSEVEQLSITTTEYGKQITDANSRIDQNAQAIGLKVDIKKVEEYVGGIKYLNEIRNTRFKKDLKYWKFEALNVSRDESKTLEGDASARIKGTGASNSCLTSEQVKATVGQKVAISAYFQTENIAEHKDGKMKLAAVFYDASGAQIKEEILEFTLNEDVWIRQELRTTVPEGATHVAFRSCVIENGTMWVAHPMLQFGETATSFIENPNDIVDKDEIMEDLADKVATADYDQKVTDIERRITANEKGIELSAKATDVYTKTESDGTFAKDAYVKEMEGRIEVTENEISNTVRKGEVISEINQTAETIKIKADLIDLVGKVKAEWIVGQLLSGLQLRTSNTNNYVSLDDQFMRLYESGVVRLYVGYHRRTDGSVQPTLILGGDNTVSTILGTLQMTQMGAGWPTAVANIGIVDEVINGVTYKSVFWEMQRNGLSVFHANDAQINYSGVGSWYFRRGKTGLYNTSLALIDFGNDSYAEMRLPTVKLRNSRASGYRDVIQVLTDSVGDGWGGVQAHILTPSLREYKSNIRDVSFSALEKVRNAKIRQFNYKGDVNLLYEMRENKDPNDPPLTTKDIKQYYGLIVDEADEVFVDKDKTGTHLYSMTSLTMKAVQELEEKHDQQIAVLNEKLEAKDMEIATMNSRIASLESLVQSLIDKRNQTETEQQ